MACLSFLQIKGFQMRLTTVAKLNIMHIVRSHTMVYPNSHSPSDFDFVMALEAAKSIICNRKNHITGGGRGCMVFIDWKRIHSSWDSCHRLHGNLIRQNVRCEIRAFQKLGSFHHKHENDHLVCVGANAPCRYWCLANVEAMVCQQIGGIRIPEAGLVGVVHCDVDSQCQVESWGESGQREWEGNVLKGGAVHCDGGVFHFEYCENHNHHYNSDNHHHNQAATATCRFLVAFVEWLGGLLGNQTWK